MLSKQNLRTYINNDHPDRTNNYARDTIVCSQALSLLVGTQSSLLSLQIVIISYQTYHNKLFREEKREKNNKEFEEKFTKTGISSTNNFHNIKNFNCNNLLVQVKCIVSHTTSNTYIIGVIDFLTVINL